MTPRPTAPSVDSPPDARPVCDRCRRPASVCFCAHLPRFSPPVRLLLLQHPRERRVPISTCRMAHLAFEGSMLRYGVRFDDDAVVAEAVAARGTAVLFPGAEARDPSTLPAGWLETLIVVDGTWSQARKIVERNPLLAGLPRVGLAPSRPGNYRIRREPAEHCLSTIEAVVEVLGLVAGDVDRYRAALTAFDHMVDTQIERRAARLGPSRYKRKRERAPRPPSVPAILRQRGADAVALYAEANAGSDPDGHPVIHQILHLLAVRPGTGERFEAVIRPAGPLGPSVPRQLELPAERLLAGRPLAEALNEFDRFRGGSLLCGWGRFAREVAGLRPGDNSFLDLRVAASKRLRRRTGGIEQAAHDLEGPLVEPWAGGRGGRRIAALQSVLSVLVGEARSVG